MSVHTCEACGHPLDQYWRDDHASASTCKDCDAALCSDCAAFWEAEGGYGDDGSQVRVTARCKPCETAYRAEKALRGGLRCS